MIKVQWFRYVFFLHLVHNNIFPIIFSKPFLFYQDHIICSHYDQEIRANSFTHKFFPQPCPTRSVSKINHFLHICTLPGTRHPHVRHQLTVKYNVNLETLPYKIRPGRNTIAIHRRIKLSCMDHADHSVWDQQETKVLGSFHQISFDPLVSHLAVSATSMLSTEFPSPIFLLSRG